MRIVHLPTDIAGQMGWLCYGLKQAGKEVCGYNWTLNYLDYRTNTVSTDGYELNKMIEPLVQNCDLFHFHNGNTFLLENQDLSFIAAAGKKLVMHHWGNDVRSRKIVQQKNPYPLPPSYLTDEEIHNRLVKLSSYIDTAIVQDHEMVPYIRDYYKHVHVLPLACRVQNFTPAYPAPDKAEPLIIHAPTNRQFKGSMIVEQVIEKLKGRARFSYMAVEKMSNRDAIRAYSSGDIIIDQILCGSHGFLSVEAMALGKVVVAFIRDDVRVNMPTDLPIVNANPDTLESVLQELIAHPELRHQIGIASRQYVEKYHSVEKVTEQLLAIYQQL